MYISRTNISNINVSHLENLSYLDIAENNITYLDLSKNEKFRTLSTSNNLAWLDIGEKNGISIYTLKNGRFSLGAIGNSFKIQEQTKLGNIDKNKVTIIENGKIDQNTDIVYGYNFGEDIVYKYDCGTINGKPLKYRVSLSFSKAAGVKGESAVVFHKELDKTHDGKAVEVPENDIEFIGSQEIPEYSWWQKDGEGWKELDKAPVQAGEYKLVVNVPSDDYYNGCQGVQDFIISKAKPSYQLPKSLNGYIGDTLEDIQLPSGWKWQDISQIIDKEGIQTYKAVYIPEDTLNYETVYNIDLPINGLIKKETVDSDDNSHINITVENDKSQLTSNDKKDTQNNVLSQDTVKTDDNSFGTIWVIGMVLSIAVIGIVVKCKKN